ncbi:YpeB-like protein with putative protease inhibitory function [Humibacillus xanthopallidus]|uniref:YpeB-like protein with putative protease inhibitory function n=1 Tax=Humibacillus xanthopallidus TaxID=412689 RepID=A0A543PU33_9MICO|nr:hypothetical protein [Humibacillus xanthopallidus]TQN47581.1 YpeB-like protein with putative protease inhibitory function [Humibacillus xanthopallidus]
MNKKTIALAGAGIVAASALALGGAALASADETGTGATTANGYGQGSENGQQGMRGGMGNGNTDPSKPMRSDEKLLTGDTATKVTAAAKAKEPGATIERVETDSDGIYEAHMVRADGTHITVQVDASFTVTGVQEGGPGAGGPGGGRGGMSGMGGDHDGEGPGAQLGESGQPSQPGTGSTTAPSTTAPSTT